MILPVTHQTGFAQWGGESMAPGLWRDHIGGWVMALGSTGDTVLDRSIGRIGAPPHNGTYSNISPSDAYVPGKNPRIPGGWAINFDEPSSDHIELGTNAQILGSSNVPFSVVVMARHDGAVNGRAGIIKGQRSDGGDGWDLRLEASGSPANGLCFSVGTFNTDVAVFAQADFDVNLYHSYAGVYDGGNMFAYVDGVQGGTTDTGALTDFDEIIAIGEGFEGFRYFNGSIQYVLMWHRVLSDGELRLLSQDPMIMFRIDEDIQGRVPTAAAARRIFVIS